MLPSLWNGIYNPAMSLMPSAVQRLLPESARQQSIKPTQLIIHSAVDAPGPTRLEKYFGRESVPFESHFWVPFPDETIQMMDTEVRADCNRRANRRADGTGALSAETEDDGKPDTTPWTDSQIDRIVAIAIWAHEEHAIPLVVCKTPSSPGIGYHTLFGAPSAWTPSRGKTCPGKIRIAQFYDVIMPRLEAYQEDNTMKITATVARARVLEAYERVLHRAAEPDAVGFWVGEIVSGARSIEDVRWEFICAALGAEKAKAKSLNDYLVGRKDLNIQRDEIESIAEEVFYKELGELAADALGKNAE